MARKAGTEHGTERPIDQDAETRAADGTGGPVPDPADPMVTEDPALRLDAVSEEGLGAAPRADSPDILRPDEPADALVAEVGIPAEETHAVRSWDDQAGAVPPDAFDEPLTGSAVSDDPAGSGARGQSVDPGEARSAWAAGPAVAEAPSPYASAPRVERAEPPPSVAPRRSGLGGLLLGGFIAAGLGYGAAWLAQDRLGGARLPVDIEERLAAIEARPSAEASEVQALDERIAGVETRLAALEEGPAPAGDPGPDAAPQELEPFREEVTASLASAEARATELEERLAALEARPAAPAEAPLGSLATDPGPALQAAAGAEAPDVAADGSAALEPRLAAVEAGLAQAGSELSETGTALGALEERVGSNEAALSGLEGGLGEASGRLDGAEARLDTVESRLSEVESTGAVAVEEARAAAAALAETQSRAEAAEAEARRGAAIAALGTALDAGEPFEAALPALGSEVPEALARAAPQGVASLATLRESFPEAARAGLAAARGAGLLDEGGVSGWVLGQLSVRSTAPREGSDPDAVLSRAEAALARGRLSEALSEVESLPEPVQAAMADWIAQARARVEVEAALESLRAAEPPAAPAD